MTFTSLFNFLLKIKHGFFSGTCYHHPIADPTKVVTLDPQPNNNLKFNPLYMNSYSLYSKFPRKPSQQYEERDLSFMGGGMDPNLVCLPGITPAQKNRAH